MNIDEFLIPYRTATGDYEEHCEKGEEFNMFHLIQKIYGISETKHSRFLAFLLDPNENLHGQKDLYLNLFLDKLLIIYDKNDKNRKWIVEAENKNADISIKSFYPDKISIVIENKCFDAKDQDKQLYRYWYDHIFNFFDKNYEASSNFDKCRIVYLPKGDWKVYDKESVQKIDKNYPDIDTKIITSWTFYNHISTWLAECIAINKQPERMKSFISDYKKYWDETETKNNLILNQMHQQFNNEKQWKDFVELANRKEELKKNWIEQFEIDFKKIENTIWFYYKLKLYDLRFYPQSPQHTWRTCFVYEYDKGISIWKEGISQEKKKEIRKDLEKVLNDVGQREFEFVETDFHGNETYIMKYYKNDDLVFNNEDDFAWNAGNGKLAERISQILSKFLTPEIKELFDEIDEK